MGKTVCVIDDDEIFRKISLKMISLAGVFDEASYYRNAQEAFLSFSKKEADLPDIILLDINMPQMDGWQFLEELENRFPELYENTDIYIVSSSIAESDRIKSEEFEGLKGFITKPLTVQTLKSLAEK